MNHIAYLLCDNCVHEMSTCKADVDDIKYDNNKQISCKYFKKRKNNSCEQRKCEFWTGEYCRDYPIYVNSDNGIPCCRYHPNAVLEEEGDSL